MSHRMEQLSENIRHELSQMFSRELEMPLDCLVTISQVKISDDLHWAQIWLSILPLSSRSKVRNIIKGKQGLLQSLLNKRLRMKPIPKLQFFTDFTEEKAQGIEALIDKALKEI